MGEGPACVWSVWKRGWRVRKKGEIREGSQIDQKQAFGESPLVLISDNSWRKFFFCCYFIVMWPLSSFVLEQTRFTQKWPVFKRLLNVNFKLQHAHIQYHCLFTRTDRRKRWAGTRPGKRVTWRAEVLRSNKQQLSEDLHRRTTCRFICGIHYFSVLWPGSVMDASTFF